MLDRADVVYQYDGSFEGLMCCVFESYEKKEIPSDVCAFDAEQTNLLPKREIPTDAAKAGRVIDSIPKKMGANALSFIRHAFLTYMEQKELYILLFMHKGYQIGPRIINMLSDEVVNKLFRAVNHLKRESHLLKGFIRFSEYDKILVAQIEPKNDVLPLLVMHFCGRYPNERFLIYDQTHERALVYQPKRWEIVSMEGFIMPEADEREQFFRDLWRLFYDTIEIKERHNEKCRMSHMPKRFWANMTELSDEGGGSG